MTQLPAKPLPFGRELGHPCPDCGEPMVLKPSKFGGFYGCKTFPACRATHSAHKGTGEPMGVPANNETKAARMEAHRAFDRLWQRMPGCNQKQALKEARGFMNRQEAYSWMATAMGMSHAEAHIGNFDVAQCEALGAKVEELRAHVREHRERWKYVR